MRRARAIRSPDRWAALPASVAPGASPARRRRTRAPRRPRSGSRLDPCFLVRQALVPVARIGAEDEVPQGRGDPVTAIRRLEVMHEMVLAQPLARGGGGS